MLLIELVIGIIIAAITILVIQIFPPVIHRQIYAIALIIAAFIYLGFSSWSENITWILTEIVGVIIFSIIAFTGIKYSSWFLVMGWLIHPTWDLLIDNHNLTQFIPQWYPTVCIAYDIVIALYIAFKCIEKEENNPFLN